MKEKVNKKTNPLGYRGMHLLNPANMAHITGGEEAKNRKDLSCGFFKVYLCAFEVNCSGNGFTYDCHGTKFSAECGKGTAFSIKPL
jgi:hypothetical protein